MTVPCTKYTDIASRVSAAQVACPYFCLQSDLLEIPTGATLRSLTRPVALTAIADNAFRSCKNLANLTLPAALTIIGVVASRSPSSPCLPPSRRSVTAPCTLTGLEPQASIDHQACLLLTRLSLALDSTTLTLPAGHTTIGHGATVVPSST